MPETPQEFRVRLVRDALTSYSDEYKEWDDRWKTIEGKAQASIVIAGIFTGGAIDIIGKLEATAPTWQKIFAWLVIGSLLIVVVLVALALRVRRIVSSPSGEVVESMLFKTLAVTQANELFDREERFLRDEMGMWRQANRDLARLNEYKARLITAAQWLLLLSVLAIVPLEVSKMLGT